MMKDLFSWGHKGKRKSTSARKKSAEKIVEKTTITEKAVKSICPTPSTSPKSYLEEDIWDILPKTGYTYAQSGSYSPRFLGRKVVTPNMSRHRLRGGRRSTAVAGGGTGGVYDDDEIDGEYEEYEDFSDLEDGITMETVIEDGMELRSGKNLYHLTQMIHEHEQKEKEKNLAASNQTGSVSSQVVSNQALNAAGNLNNSSNARSRTETKSRRQSHKHRQLYQTQSQSEDKRHSTRYSDSLSLTRPAVDYSNVQVRRRLENNFKGGSATASVETDSYRLQQSSAGYDNNFSSNNAHRSRRSRSGLDGGKDSYTTYKTTSTTVMEEFDEDLDRNDGALEKGSIEASEKASSGSSEDYTRPRYIDHSYGLDEEEYSDRETVGSNGTWGSYSSSGGRYGNGRHGNSSRSDYSDNSGSYSTTTTIVTTITETVSSVSRAVVSPVWNAVGRPVMRHVAAPVWTQIVHPTASVLASLLLTAWSIVAWPMAQVARATSAFGSWVRVSGVGGILEEMGLAAAGFWEMVERVVMKAVLVDVWLFKRHRRNGCCLCLPLLLLLPLLFALFSGSQLWNGAVWKDRMWGAQSSIAGIWTRDSSPPPVIINENKEYQTLLNQEVRNMLVQLQTSNSQNQLSAADVEAIVYRILNKESATLRADLHGSQNEHAKSQLQWKTEQEVRLGDMRNKQDDLMSVIKDLEATIANQKAAMASQGAGLKAESAAHLANQEEKLATLQAELRAREAELRELEAGHAALLARVNACCHNETYYAAAIKDNVDAILAQMMAGQISGNPSQDAFTQWLHSHYVSRSALDQKLKALTDDLTAQVMAMVQDSQAASQAKIQEALAARKEAESRLGVGVGVGTGTGDVHLHGNMYGVGEQQVRDMIEAALFKYSADKTGLPDFALESAGGTVISTRCSETYDRKTTLIKVFGLPIWYLTNSPRTVLQPEVLPGDCWAFKGPTGYIVIQTSIVITPSGFTLEHIPKSLSPNGKIESAPKDFTVFGLQDEYDTNGHWLGNFTYHDDGPPIQFFPAVVKGDRTTFKMYELRILSNHGNLEYTCLYRFRIHGKPYTP